MAVHLPLSIERLGEPSAAIRARIEKAREIQRTRFAGMMGGARGNLPLLCNADMGPAEVREYCHLDDSGKSLPLDPAMTQLGMSARAFHRILKLARTIADLGAPEIKTYHLVEAIQYRLRGQT